MEGRKEGVMEEKEYLFDGESGAERSGEVDEGLGNAHTNQHVALHRHALHNLRYLHERRRRRRRREKK